VYPPPTLGLVYGVAALPYAGVQVAWCVVQFALGVGGVLLLLRGLGCAVGSIGSLLVILPFALSPAFAELFRWGQFDMIIVALLSGAMVASIRGRSGLAGALVGLAAAAKLTPLIYLGVFVVRREWRALAASVVTIVIVTGASCGLLGGEGVSQWLVNLRDFGNEPQGTISPENMSLLGFAYRAFVAGERFQGPSVPWWDLGPAAATWASRAACVALILPTFGWIARHRARISTADAIAALVPVALLVSPRTWTHHTVALIVPILVLVLAVVRSRHAARFDFTALACVLLLLTNSPVLQFGVELPPALAHLLTPVPTFAAFATWLFMLARLIPLRVGAVRARRENHPPHFASASAWSASASAT
jgi:alpha-1,2-mannosyltransferase